MRNRHVFAVDRVGRPGAHRFGRQMGDDLVAAKIEIDPALGASTLGAAEQPAVKGAGRGEIVDREGEMEERLGHALSCHCEGSDAIHWRLDCVVVNSSQ